MNDEVRNVLPARPHGSGPGTGLNGALPAYDGPGGGRLPRLAQDLLVYRHKLWRDAGRGVLARSPSEPGGASPSMSYQPTT